MRHHDRDDGEKHEGTDVGGIGNREGIDWRKKEEIVAQRRGDGREQRGPKPVTHGDRHHRRQKDEIDVFDSKKRLNQLADAEGHGNRKQRGGIGPGIERGGVFGRTYRFLGDRIARELFAGDDVHADIAGAPHQIMHHGAVQDLEPSRPRRLADDDLGDVVRVGEADHVIRDAAITARNGDRLAAQRLGQTQGVGDAVAFDLAPLQAAPRLHAQRRKRGVQPVRQALGITHEAGGARVFADAD
jgi:hypothetical protein